MLRRLIPLAVFAAAPLAAQELPVGQGEAEYQAWLASSPGVRAQVLSFESWQEAAGVRGVLPTWQLLRTASMWSECGGAPFEVPPHHFWPDMVRTLKFVRDHVRPVLGPVEAVSGYRNPALNQCARGSSGSAHLDFFALDLIPLQPLTRRQLFERLCPLHARSGPAAGAGLGFYGFTRFHVDTRGFRRWGSAGPLGNESPCAVLERGGDPEAPPLPLPESPPAQPTLPSIGTSFVVSGQLRFVEGDQLLVPCGRPEPCTETLVRDERLAREAVALQGRTLTLRVERVERCGSGSSQVVCMRARPPTALRIIEWIDPPSDPVPPVQPESTPPQP